MHACETHAYEMHAHEVHAHEVHARGIHARELHVHKMHASEVRAHEGFREDLARHNTVARRFPATARFRRRHIRVSVIVVAS
jgi:hypothetical protein